MLARDSWKSFAASAGEQVVRRSIGGGRPGPLISVSGVFVVHISWACCLSGVQSLAETVRGFQLIEQASDDVRVLGAIRFEMNEGLAGQESIL